MDLFQSTVTNKIDAKGRVSLPASFRAVLAAEGWTDRFWCTRSLDNDHSFDAGGVRLKTSLTDRVSRLDVLSPQYNQLARAIFAGAEEVKFDAEGRLVLPASIRETAEITTHVTFAGQGLKFQIWQPERFKAAETEARDQVRSMLQTLSEHPSPVGATNGGQS